MSNKILRLIEVKKANKIIFIGDTHGDFEASKRIVKNYLKPGNVLVFLGDYVDRGPFSRGNLDFLLKTKQRFLGQIHLLMGNHEGQRIQSLSPTDFWDGLEKSDYEKYASIVESFPFVFMSEKIIALHGVLPDVKNLEEINNIELGSEEWEQICWGDFKEESGNYLRDDPFTSRPQFGLDWFNEMMARFNKNVLIRAHQPDCSEFMFDNRCLTIFTSSAYDFRKRTIAIFDSKKEIKTAKDLEIVEI